MPIPPRPGLVFDQMRHRWVHPRGMGFVYPVGTVVEMEGGEMATVIGFDRNSQTYYLKYKDNDEEFSVPAQHMIQGKIKVIEVPGRNEEGEA